MAYSGQYVYANQLLWSLLKIQISFSSNLWRNWEKYLKCNGSLDLNLVYFGVGESTCQEVITVLRLDSHIYFCTNLPSRNKIILSLQCQSAYPPKSISQVSFSTYIFIWDFLSPPHDRTPNYCLEVHVYISLPYITLIIGEKLIFKKKST